MWYNYTKDKIARRGAMNYALAAPGTVNVIENAMNSELFNNAPIVNIALFIIFAFGILIFWVAMSTVSRSEKGVLRSLDTLSTVMAKVLEDIKADKIQRDAKDETSARIQQERDRRYTEMFEDVEKSVVENGKRSEKLYNAFMRHDLQRCNFNHKSRQEGDDE